MAQDTPSPQPTDAPIQTPMREYEAEIVLVFRNTIQARDDAHARDVLQAIGPEAAWTDHDWVLDETTRNLGDSWPLDDEDEDDDPLKRKA